MGTKVLQRDNLGKHGLNKHEWVGGGGGADATTCHSEMKAQKCSLLAKRQQTL